MVRRQVLPLFGDLAALPALLTAPGLSRVAIGQVQGFARFGAVRVRVLEAAE